MIDSDKLTTELKKKVGKWIESTGKLGGQGRLSERRAEEDQKRWGSKPWGFWGERSGWIEQQAQRP